jgi:hypothetical protein
MTFLKWMVGAVRAWDREELGEFLRENRRDQPEPQAPETDAPPRPGAMQATQILRCTHPDSFGRFWTNKLYVYSGEVLRGRCARVVPEDGDPGDTPLCADLCSGISGRKPFGYLDSWTGCPWCGRRGFWTCPCGQPGCCEGSKEAGDSYWCPGCGRETILGPAGDGPADFSAIVEAAASPAALAFVKADAPVTENESGPVRLLPPPLLRLPDLRPKPKPRGRPRKRR